MLEEGDIGVADFKIPNEVAPGRYRILVQASQDSVFKNKVFEKTMTFPELGGFRVITFLVGLILLVLSIFLLRSGLRKIDVLTKLKFLIPMSLQKSFKRDDEIDIDKFLQEILVKNKRKIERAEKRQNSTKAAKLQKKRIVKSKKKSPARKQVKKKNTKIRSK
jgi:sensor histidine kinase YesM